MDQESIMCRPGSKLRVYGSGSCSKHQVFMASETFSCFASLHKLQSIPMALGILRRGGSELFLHVPGRLQLARPFEIRVEG